MHFKQKNIYQYAVLVEFFVICKMSKQKKVKFANSIDPDEAAHKEPLHLDLLCLPSSALAVDFYSQYDTAWVKHLKIIS